MADTLRREVRDDVVVLTLDRVGRSVNIVDEELLDDLGRELEAAIDGVAAGIVLASGKDAGFGVGADLGWLPTLAARDDAAAYLAGVHALMLRIVRSDVPLVAAVHGTALGGALELALAADAIVATPDAMLGLPEVTLGLLPGGGGTQLLARVLPLDVASDLLTSGRKVRGDEAAALGLVAEVRPREDLVAAAVELARSGPRRPERAPDLDVDAALAAIEDRRRALTSGRLGISPAAARILDVLAVGVSDGIEAGLTAERDGFLALLRSPEARATIHLFTAEADVRRRARGGVDRVSRLGVVGGGQMGGGIAATAATRGVPVVVRDVDDEAIGRARAYLDRVLTRRPGDGAERWTGTTTWGPLAGTDAVVEAVFEDPDLKRDVLTQAADVAGPAALIATNTSAISIAGLADSLPDPARFLGMHFFSPVERMPLVELIPHAETSPETLSRAAALGARLGKVPVVVGDSPGFCTSRVYARWLIEGVRLVLDGVAPAVVDGAARDVGFPVGPLQAHDEATLDLVLAASITQVADRLMQARLDVVAVRAALEALVEAGIRGRRHGEGFSRYDEEGRRAGPNPRVSEVLGSVESGSGPDRSEVGERLLLAFATECFLCWDEGVLCHPDDGDVASVLGIGFPRALGGPFHWADEVGAVDVVARCGALGREAFPPGQTLQRLAADGGTFAEQPRRPAPFAPPTSAAPR